MATYSYVAKDALGKVITGTSEAENEQILVRRLREKGYFVQKVSSTRAAAAPKATAKKKGGGFSIGRVTGRDLSVFCRQFATMIDAGVSLVRCLAVLEEQSTSGRLRQIIREVQASVESGETLSRALGRYPRIFGSLFVGLVRAGEVGGVLDETLNRLSTFLEENERLKRKVKSAMTYPVLVLFFAMGVVILLVTKVLPQFITVFKDLGIKDASLPAPTQMLVQVSNFVTTKWYMVILISLGLFVAFGQYVHTRIGRRHFDWVKIKVPVFGKLNHKICIARFSRTLSTLLVSGVPILGALETVAGAVDNNIVADAILSARAAIREGEQIGDPLQRSGMFPPMVVQMIAIGEETGSLDAMLAKVADFYEAEVDATLASLAAALEPLMIVFLGVIVGFIVISMFLPLVQVISSLQSGSMEGDSGGE
jgi:type IV pilus assembly protein PilC